MLSLRLSLRRAALAGVFSLLLIPAVASAQATEDRRRALADWLVEDVGNADGGRTIRVSREQDGFHVDFHILVAAGASEPDSYGVASGRSGCARGGEDSIARGHADDYAGQARADLIGDLERCSAAPQQVEALLGGFDGAVRLAIQWAGERTGAQAAAAASPAPAEPPFAITVETAGGADDAADPQPGAAPAEVAGGVWDPGTPAPDDVPAADSGWGENAKPR